MRVAVFSSKPYDRLFLETANKAYQHELVFFEARLSQETAVLAKGFPAVCIFVNDQLDAPALGALAQGGTGLVALRCAGFNNVDLKAAQAHEMLVVRVPAYSPHAVAEHTAALLLTLNRKVHRANNRVREGNFALDGLLGFDIHGLTVGIVGTGKIGLEVARIMRGFGCPIVAYDLAPHPESEQIGIRYVSLEELFAVSDIITLHCPLTPETYHLVNAPAIAKMKMGVVLLNTSRGALVDTAAVIEGLKSGKIGYLGLDVYEEEGDLFFEDLSNVVIQDDVFARLLLFPNVLITGHQAFFTRNALENIAHITLGNIAEVERFNRCANQISA
jgi:D-lactate dehydrogenase